jgi:hypothetical protein
VTSVTRHFCASTVLAKFAPHTSTAISVWSDQLWLWDSHWESLVEDVFNERAHDTSTG